MSSILQTYALWVCNKDSERLREGERERLKKRERERERAVFSRDLWCFLMGFKWTGLHWGKLGIGSRLRPGWTNTQTHTYDAVNLDIALGLIKNSRTAKYLGPRLSVDAANTQTHTYTKTQTDTLPFESPTSQFAAEFHGRNVLFLLL